ncbi:MAG: peptidyl-prolyl cis-trans isomerase [Burkholderiales bacterium]|nr:peptidyl-prolyl cis-trans isomerase [Burkholderiales bacterium]
MKRLLREPLLHFLAIGALLFAVHALVPRAAPSSGTVIVLTQGQMDAMASVFQRKWQRAPTPQERTHLLESLVREEILYREGVSLGLDRDDALIRRRVGQKVELLAEEAQQSSRPGDAELQAYFEANRSRFEVEPRVSFRQAFVDPGRPGRSPEREAARLLTALSNEGEAALARHPGDPTPLAQQVDAVPLSQVARDFGEQFANALSGQPQGRWQGPVRSAFGLHIVFVSEQVPARMPPLAEVREAVERDWARDRRTTASDAMYRQLRQRYTVSIEPGPGGSS